MASRATKKTKSLETPPSKVSRSKKVVKEETLSNQNISKKEKESENSDIEKQKLAQNTDSSFLLKRNKTTGNYSILRKTKVDGIPTLQRVRYTIWGAYLPFGCEAYNDNTIINAVIDNNSNNNINYNLIFTLNRITKTFDELKNNDVYKHKYCISDKKFFPFLKLVENDTKEEDTKEQDINIQKYSVRLYMKYGAKITHAKYVGEVPPDQLKGKRCNIDVELGSLWVSTATKMYGINIHVTHITVLN